MVKKKSIAGNKQRKRTADTPKPARGQPRKLYACGQVSETRCTEIDAILVTETRTYIRKRLIALRTIYAGGTNATAAREAGSSLGSVRLWLQQAESDGLASLLRLAEGGKQTYRFSKARAAKLRDAITAELARAHDPVTRTRLVVVDDVLNGCSTASAASKGGVTVTAVCGWMRDLHRHGIEALLPVEASPSIRADPSVLRSEAGRERDCRMAKRLLAIAALAEGWSLSEAARHLDVDTSTVQAWRDRFRKDGIDGLRDLAPSGRPAARSRPDASQNAALR